MQPRILFLLLAMVACSSKTDSDDADDTGTDTAVGTDTGSDTGNAPDNDWSVLDAFMEAELTAGSIPALGIAVIAKGEVVLTRGYGWANIETQLPATEKTPFMLASISKTFTGLAMMQLVESGNLDLDASIQDYIAFEVNNPHVEGETITARQLMTHTSSILDRKGLWGGPPGAENSLYTIGDSPIELGNFLEGYLVPGGDWYRSKNYSTKAPDTQYRYGNIATALGGYLIESITNMELGPYSDLNLFAPLGMTHTGWHLSDLVEEEIAMPYSQSGGNYTPYGQYGYPDYPNGALRSSAADMARYMLAVVQDGSLDGAQVLSEESVNQMFAQQIPNIDTRQGLFWYKSNGYGQNVFGHEGGDYGVATSMHVDLENDVGIVVMANTDWNPKVTNSLNKIQAKLFDIGRAW